MLLELCSNIEVNVSLITENTNVFMNCRQISKKLVWLTIPCVVVVNILILFVVGSFLNKDANISGLQVILLITAV